MKHKDYSGLDAASHAFKALGTAASELQIYTANHPRFQETLQAAARAFHDYFHAHPDTAHMTYTVNRGQCEFRRIPLLEVGAQGERLVKMFEQAGAGGIQLRRNISAREILLLLQIISSRTSRRSGASRPDAAEEEGLAKFRIISSKEAGRLSRIETEPEDPDREVEDDKGLYIPEFRVSRSSIRSILDSYRNLMNNLADGREVDLEMIENATEEAISVLAATDRFLLSSLSMGYFDDFTFHHSVNVCLITTQVASKVVQDETVLRRISLAALLHDVGKSRVPAEILHKPGKLTPAELEHMQKHPVDGAEILIGFQELDPLCVAVAYGHHMNESPHSYPKPRIPVSCDWITQLVSVVDVYEALTAVRPYKKGLPSERAFQIMLSMPGLGQRRPIIKLLYDCIGPYPVGTVVELNTGERAVILDQNPEVPDRPKIRILTDREGNRLEEQVNVDLCDPEEARLRETETSITRSVVCQRPLEDPLEVQIEPPPTDILGEEPENDEVLMAREG